MHTRIIENKLTTIQRKIHSFVFSKKSRSLEVNKNKIWIFSMRFLWKSFIGTSNFAHDAIFKRVMSLSHSQTNLRAVSLTPTNFFIFI
jgi:hypothetical protein